MSKLKLPKLTRRSLLGTALASLLAYVTARLAWAPPRRDYDDPVTITADDIAWFRACRCEWIGCESDAPYILPPEKIDSYDPSTSRVFARLERLVCAFFLHARFAPGAYAFREPLEGRHSFTVTAEHIRLLQSSSWRGGVMDCKRPYGDYTHFEIDMARALGLPILKSPEGYDEISPENEARMNVLHREMIFVLQAYAEHAELQPGKWFIPYDGWEGIILPRCLPVGTARIARYKAEMAAIRVREKVEPPTTLVKPKIAASLALFAVNG